MSGAHGDEESNASSGLGQSALSQNGESRNLMELLTRLANSIGRVERINELIEFIE